MDRKGSKGHINCTIFLESFTGGLFHYRLTVGMKSSGWEENKDHGKSMDWGKEQL